MKNTDETAKSPEKGRSRSRRRNDRRNRNRNNRPYKEKPVVNGPDCAVCGKAIRDVSAAMNDPAGEKPAHFDCVLKMLTEKEELGNQEKVIYLGSGNFGVVKVYNNKKFEILRKITYENPEARNDWRMDMRFQFPESNKKAP